jgi:suppressor of tumorigenicity protein 13
MPDLAGLFGDPELLSAFQDPEVAAAFEDISRNPANIAKYKDNPKVQALMAKMSSKFGGAARGGAGGPGEAADIDMDDFGPPPPSSGGKPYMPSQPDVD